jgi:putative oxidoreductase
MQSSHGEPMRSGEAQSRTLAPWVLFVRLLLGGIMAWGGVMHFTVDEHIWKNALMNAMAESGFLWREIGILNVVAGTALLLNRYTAVATLVLLPITTNIFLLHLWRHDAFGLTIGVPVLALNSALLYGLRERYRALID